MIKVLPFVLAPLLGLSASAPAPFSLTSPDFSNGGVISTSHEANSFGCNGKNIAPRLNWSSVPAGTRGFALTVVDPDAPKAIAPTGFVHWVAYNIPGTWRYMYGNAPTGTTGGVNSGGMRSYLGPCPPVHGLPHHYYYTLYALNVSFVGGPGLTRDALQRAVAGHVLGTAQLIGTFQRP